MSCPIIGLRWRRYCCCASGPSRSYHANSVSGIQQDSSVRCFYGVPGSGSMVSDTGTLTDLGRIAWFSTAVSPSPAWGQASTAGGGNIRRKARKRTVCGPTMPSSGELGGYRCGPHVNGPSRSCEMLGRRCVALCVPGYKYYTIWMSAVMKWITDRFRTLLHSVLVLFLSSSSLWHPINLLPSPNLTPTPLSYPSRSNEEPNTCMETKETNRIPRKGVSNVSRRLGPRLDMGWA